MKRATKSTKLPSNTKSSASQSMDLVEIDHQLLQLLTARVNTTRALAESIAKPDLMDQLWQQQNSAAQRAIESAHRSGLSTQSLSDWLRHTVSLCFHEAHVHNPIAYLGPIYSYSYLAAVKEFGLSATLVPVATISAVFDEISRGQATMGVVPIENSTDGRVVDTLGMFARMPVQICGEVLLPIHHCLLARCPRGEITEIYSKPQAMSQCRSWLSQHVPDARLIEISSTAAAARLAADKPGAAAVASREAGIHHGLEIVDENIEDNPNNVTRFALIGSAQRAKTGTDKTSVMFQLRHQPGALAQAMVIFQKAKINLTWIESFPLVNHPNEYLFFVELDGHNQSKNVAAALAQLGKQTLRMEVLGSYPKANM